MADGAGGADKSIQEDERADTDFSANVQDIKVRLTCSFPGNAC